VKSHALLSDSAACKILMLSLTKISFGFFVFVSALSFFLYDLEVINRLYYYYNLSGELNTIFQALLQTVRLQSNTVITDAKSTAERQCAFLHDAALL